MDRDKTTPRSAGRGRIIPKDIRLEVDTSKPEMATSSQVIQQQQEAPPLQRNRSTKGSSKASTAAKRAQLDAKKKTIDLKKQVSKIKKQLQKAVAEQSSLAERINDYTVKEQENPEGINDQHWKEKGDLRTSKFDVDLKVANLKIELQNIEDEVKMEIELVNDELQIELEEIGSEDDLEDDIVVEPTDHQDKVQTWLNNSAENDVQKEVIASTSTSEPGKNVEKGEEKFQLNACAAPHNVNQEFDHSGTPPLPHPPQQQKMNEHKSQFDPYTAPFNVKGARDQYAPPPPQQRQQKMNEASDHVVSQLVSALGQAFGQRQETVTFKSRADMELPYFDGNPEEWVAFKSHYDRTTSMYKISDCENLYRLKRALRGSAQESVKYLYSTPNNLQEIMETLELEFGRPELIIETMIHRAESLKTPDPNKPETMVEFARTVQSLVATIKGHSQEKHYLENAHLLKKLVDKLPNYKKEQWLYYVNGQPFHMKNLSFFCDWLCIQKKIACEMTAPKFKEPPEKGGKHRRHGVNVAADVEETKKNVCCCCEKGGHKIQECFIFKRLPLDDKWNIVKSKKLCFCCLEGQHRSDKCTKKEECGKDGCSKDHHPLLHRDSHVRNEKKNNDNPEVPAFLKEDDVGFSAAAAATSRESLPVIPIILHGPKGSVKAYALLDSGAASSYVEESLADRIGMEGVRDTSRIITFGGDKKTIKSLVGTVEIQGRFRSSRKFKIEAATIDKMGLQPRTHDMVELKAKFPHLRKMKAASFIKAVPRVVIGYDNYELFVAREILEDDDDWKSPRAYNSLLGWYVSVKDLRGKGCYVIENFLCHEADKEMHDIIHNFSTAEGFGVKPVQHSTRSKEDKRAIKVLEETTKFKDGKWETGLLWRDEKPNLPDSKQMGLKRLFTMERKMDTNSEFADLCIQRFDDYMKKGYLVPSSSPSQKRWYLPWFVAIHPSKKPRLVFDAAAKSNGKSLNDFLLKGPDYLNSLPGVLMRFRRHDVALSGDIKEMSHQVKLKEEDMPSQTVLFRGKDRSCAPKEYEMSVLFFGSSSSPCSAIFAKDTNAKKYQEKFPDAVKAILKDHYMDDYLGGCESEEKAVELRKQISDIHAAGGFQMCKWNSNSSVVLKTIAPELRANENIDFMENGEVQSDKTLGLQWNPKTDRFGFKLNFRRVPSDILNGVRNPTKREVASVYASIFDPLGFVCPIRLQGMIILQDIWRSGIGWDDKFSILRSYARNLAERENIELHIFCDAGEEAFSSSIYLRVFTGGSVTINIVFGKVCDAPLIGLTNPSMKLNAALLEARIATAVLSTLSDDLKRLTPNHLFNMKCIIGASIPGEYTKHDLYSKSYQYGQYFGNQFWKRWHQELPWMAKREKWNGESKPLRVGYVVHFAEENATRNQWKDGLIGDVYPGKDRQVRSVLMKVDRVDPEEMKKVRVFLLRRPAVKMCKIVGGETSVSREGEMSVLHREK